MNDLVARCLRYAEEGKDDRAVMRRKYPGHAEIVDWVRSGGMQVASVEVDGKRFGERTKDYIGPFVHWVSEFAEMLKHGRIQPSGKIRVRRRLVGTFPRVTEKDENV